jgi:ketosteroid isomerase-like protein
MVKVQAVAAEIEMLRRVYAAFNRRDIETVLGVMHSNVDWPNGMEGGRVLGTAAVRDYWTRQFGVLDPRVEPQSFTTEADGRIAVDVHQVVHDKAGKLLADRMVQHVYQIREGLIQSMEIREAHEFNFEGCYGAQCFLREV